MIIYKIDYAKLVKPNFKTKLEEKIMIRTSLEETWEKFDKFLLYLTKEITGINTDSLETKKTELSHLLPPILNDDEIQIMLNKIMEKECHKCKQVLEIITEKYWWFGKKILITLQCPTGMHFLCRIKIKL